MSPKTRPEETIDRWPVLSLLGGSSVLLTGGEARLFSNPIIVSESRSALLESGEFDLARGRAIDLAALFWKPSSLQARHFLEFCLQSARQMGGIRIHSLFGMDLPLEALEREDERDESSPIFLRLQEMIFQGPAFPAPLAPGPVDEESRKPESGRRNIFVYFNPAGDRPLPQARSDSEEMVNLLLSSGDVNYTARSLSEGELHEKIDRAEIVFYFGHGKTIEGFPAIPSPEGWIPFSTRPAGEIESRKIFIFAACLEERALPAYFPPGCAVYPCCRIADRKSDFVADLIGAWIEGYSFLGAFQRARILDKRKKDIRRFVFRIQGLSNDALLSRFFG